MSSLFSAKQVWEHLCAKFQLEYSQAVYNTWFLNNHLTELYEIDGGSLKGVITSPTGFHRNNFKKNFHQAVVDALHEYTEKSVDLDYLVGTVQPTTSQPEMTKSVVQNIRPTNVSTTTTLDSLFSETTISATTSQRADFSALKAGLKKEYVFETFAVSTTNEMAHAASQAVSQRPGQAYNPLFLYGGVGVGKTHLMHAIGHNILKTTPQARILYCTGEMFTNEIVSAIKTKRALQFKEKYRTAQVLLIDDIQFIAGKNAVQEEFFHTFNALVQNQGQVVMTSDRPPHEIPLLEDRLQSRFQAGLMIDIQEPSFELRTAILLIKANTFHLTISMEIAQTIAARLDSARKIEGLLTRVRSAVELQHRQITPELVEELLSVEKPVISPTSYLRVHPTTLIKSVANHYHIQQSELKGKSRIKNVATARHVAMFLMKKNLGLHLQEIGRWFSNRDHTTVMHGVDKITLLLTQDPVLQQDVAALKTTLQSIAK